MSKRSSESKKIEVEKNCDENVTKEKTVESKLDLVETELEEMGAANSSDSDGEITFQN